jgi:hypothetical protein
MTIYTLVESTICEEGKTPTGERGESPTPQEVRVGGYTGSAGIDNEEWRVTTTQLIQRPITYNEYAYAVECARKIKSSSKIRIALLYPTCFLDSSSTENRTRSERTTRPDPFIFQLSSKR